MRIIILALILAIAPVAARAQTPSLSLDERLMSAADSGLVWVAKPSEDEIALAAPERARRDRIRGRVTLECVLDAEGRPHGCAVHRETPSDLGLGAAALKLAPAYRLAPTDEPLAGHKVRIPVRFDLGPMAPLPPVTPPPERLALHSELRPALGAFAVVLGEAALLFILAWLSDQPWRPRVRRVRTLDVMRAGVAFIGEFWRRAPLAGVLGLSSSIAGLAFLQAHAPLAWPLGCGALSILGSVQALGAGYRLGGNGIDSGGRDVAPGPLGLRVGGVEFRVALGGAIFVGMLFFVQGVLLRPLATALVNAVGWEGSGWVIARFVRGYVALTFLMGRFRLVVVRAAFGHGFDPRSSDRLSRGALTPCVVSMTAPAFVSNLFVIALMLVASTFAPDLVASKTIPDPTVLVGILIWPFWAPFACGTDLALIKALEPEAPSRRAH